MVQRWHLHDPVLNEDYTFPVNPNKMTSPHGPRSLAIHVTAPATLDNNFGRVLESNEDPYEWSFAGFIRTQDHHDALLYWAGKVRPIELTDHFGRTWSVRMTTISLDEKRPTARVDWRFDYEIKAINYGLAS